MKYTKEYCKENKIAISVTDIEQLKKVQEIFNTDYSEYNYNKTSLKYPNQYLIAYKSSYGNIYGNCYDYKLITFEELMQDLNQNKMKIIKVKLKKDLPNFDSGVEFQISNPNNYYIQGAKDKFGELVWLYWNNEEFFEFIYEKPEFKVGNYVYYLGNINGGINTSSWYEGVIGIITDISSTIINGNFRNKEKDFYGGNSPGAFRLCTSEEIQKYKESQELKIGDYKLEIIRGHLTAMDKAKFGCQEFDINELRAIKRLFNKSLKANITLVLDGKATILKEEFLDKVIAKF